MGRLDGKVAVITGATSGIGLHTAEMFVAEGARIVIAGRRVPEGEALAKKLGVNCIFRQTDVTVEAQMEALIVLSVEKFGRIDCLFNNAGGPAQTGGIEGLDVERFDAAMATLLRSVMLAFTLGDLLLEFRDVRVEAGAEILRSTRGTRCIHPRSA